MSIFWFAFCLVLFTHVFSNFLPAACLFCRRQHQQHCCKTVEWQHRGENGKDGILNAALAGPRVAAPGAGAGGMEGMMSFGEG